MYLNIEFKDEEILAVLEDVKKLACELERKVAFLSGRINLEASVQEEKDCRQAVFGVKIILLIQRKNALLLKQVMLNR